MRGGELNIVHLNENVVNKNISKELLDKIKIAPAIVVHLNTQAPALFCRGYMNGNANSIFYNIHSSSQYFKCSINNTTGYVQIVGPLTLLK